MAKGEGLERFKNRQWVEITATVKKEPNDAYQGEGPVLYVTAIAPCEKAQGGGRLLLTILRPNCV